VTSARVRSNITAIKSVPWNGWNALLVFLVPWIVLPLAVSVALSVIAPHEPAVNQFVQGLANNAPGPSFALDLLDAAGSFAFIGYYLRKHHVGLKELGMRPFSLGRAILLIGGIFVAFGLLVTAAYTLISWLYPSFNAGQAQTNQFIQVHSSISLWALVIIPPFVEESTFRGFMFPAFAKRFGIVGGALLTSFLFGFAHLQPNISVYTFILSLLLCFLYTRLGSIIPGIAVHMLNNYVAYMAIQHTK
jgi:membrane protease YdiL (CAAX protease family)